MDVSQYMGMFLEESMDNLQTLNEALLDLEQEPDNIDKVNEIFRVAHTIKGMAATMGFSNIAELTHKMEDVLSKFREGKLQVSRNVVTVLFECLDTLERMVSNIEEGNDEEVEIENIMKSLENVGNEKISINKQKEMTEEYDTNKGNEVSKDSINIALNEYDLSVLRQAKQNGFNGVNVEITLREDTLLKSARAFLIVQELETQGEILKSFPSTEDIENEQFDTELIFVLITTKSKEEIEEITNNISEVRKVVTSYVSIEDIHQDEKSTVQDEIVSELEKIHIKDNISSNKIEKQDKKKDNNKKAHQSVRVDLQRIDKLMNMVSELVIYRTRLEQIVINDKSQELIETLEQVERTTSDLQDLVMKIRMLPLEVVFNRFPRMIRDLSVELKKEINFIIEGSETELDRTVIDEIGEPLIHLLRNAADHGIETKEERITKGKDPVGTIRLVAYQEGTKALIKVTDDGAGINLEKVKAKAEKVGINTDGLSDNDIRNLIFAQGFSTNTVVTDISGRGVGMDVVKTKISSLGGTVDVISEEGKGSSFIIKLPLTLQIIQALLVKVGNETLAISLGFIDRVIDYKEENVKKTNGEEVIVYRDSIIPLIRLSDRLGIENKESKKKFIIIVKVGEKTVGLLVDSLFGQQEIVIKPLGRTLKSLKEYIGATILGNGLVTLILDVAALI
ncbi:chemotaxis protein CheA [Clostridium tertium]|uniref:chemotaxis protein CheA n=1 Tax=Clostridium TaxID=1485 RepID=UPI00115A6273|nr:MULTISPECIES: chemotaxis protein CheA [Clostridium]MBS5307406.1 chemotaxis protein CheA [Clostridium sp.]MDB1922494.1 chemotaxis protein CheA [Clostridium tertium]MDB1926289.1 chemotaxis protein CheA [Clostridium tertium]MDB1928851.1 chemotaxis protein CheA [Clostridium tertium]MDB1932231.1 chemotaxis protein CheA [Clostridium tertium]